MSEGLGQTPNDLKPEILPQTQRTRIARHDEIELHGRKAALTRPDERVAAHGPRDAAPVEVRSRHIPANVPRHLAGWHAGNRYQRPRRR